MVDRRFALRSMIFITDLKIDFFWNSMHRVFLLLVNIYTKNKFQSNLLQSTHDATDSWLPRGSVGDDDPRQP